jgi:hypothetical protein
MESCPFCVLGKPTTKSIPILSHFQIGMGKGCSCGRTNLNYTGSSTRVLTERLPRTSNGIKLLVCRVRPDKPPNSGSNKVPHTKVSPEIQCQNILHHRQLHYKNIQIIISSHRGEIITRQVLVFNQSSGILKSVVIIHVVITDIMLALA